MKSLLLISFVIASVFADNPDYVVIGGGISGCMVANRLATYGYSVTLLEQGIDEGQALSDFPASVQMRYADVSLLDSPFGTVYRTQRSQLLANRILQFGLGWGLGGGSLVNGAITQRPFRSDYDKWVTDEEMAGWGYDSMLNYHIAMESNSQFDYTKGINHQAAAIGGFGPIPIRDEIAFDPLVDSGYPADPNNANLYASHFAGLLSRTLGIPDLGHGISFAENPLGVGYTQKIAVGGYRVSAAHALIHPLIDPSLPTYNDKLTVLTGAEVVKMDVSENNESSGKMGEIQRLYYMYEGEEENIKAKHEYVLALGAINSPKLLLLSGVGPRDDLEALGIEVQQNIPGVGVGLQDHPVVPMVIENENPDFPNKKVDAQNLATGQAPWFGQQGGYMSVAATPMHAYWKSLNAGDDIDTQVLIFDGVPFLSYPTNNVMYSVCVDVDSPSRGKVSLRSANHNHDAVVDFGFYFNPNDLNPQSTALPPGAMVHIDCMLNVHSAVSSSDKGMFVFAPPMPAEAWAGFKYMRQIYDFLPADQLAIFNAAMGNIVRGMVLPGYHPASTLHMGSYSNPMAPVDGHMRFKTIENLRVVDASVQPIVVSANPMLSVYAVAMKAADLMMKREAKKGDADDINVIPLCNGWFVIQNEGKDAAGTWFLTAGEQSGDPVPDNWFDQGSFYVPKDKMIYLRTPIADDKTARMLHLRVEHEEVKSKEYEMDILGYVDPVPQLTHDGCVDA